MVEGASGDAILAFRGFVSLLAVEASGGEGWEALTAELKTRERSCVKFVAVV